MKNRRGITWIVLGNLLLASALGLGIFNLWENGRAGQSVNTIENEIWAEIPETQKATARPVLGEEELMSGEYEIPDYVLNPDMDMPAREIEGDKYIGILEIPTLSLSLPVASQLSYPALRKSPCRYDGTAYKGNFIISAHNYQSHFGNLKSLNEGDEVLFTDMDGNVFQYTVAALEVIMPEDIDGMKSGDWDLTMFTCTYGGQQRVTVRCKVVD